MSLLQVFRTCLYHKRLAFLMLLSLFVASPGYAALGDAGYVSTHSQEDALALVTKSSTATLYVDASDYKGVIRALSDLQADIKSVTGKSVRVVNGADDLGQHAVIVGTIGKSALIDALIASGKIDPSAIADKWDGYHLQVVNNPLPNVARALVIAGANKRGTTYGIYDVSEEIGISPWHYWADVPTRKKSEIYIQAGTKIQEFPKVKYRGIFLNDEAPALSSWVAENHGNYNHEFYIKVFDLLLRLKANFLWPAMWNNAFSDDDPQNMILADEYGIVMSNSHHEPMMRADKEWDRHGEGRWDYSVNKENLYKFWTDGAVRNKPYESLFTLGMRGQADTPMSETENIGLLEEIVSDQRKIIAEVFSEKDVSEVPQVWTLYKEVQSYYESGMRVPDDVILLWSDDNWGNIRRLPTPDERKRAGGAGVYYHFDYVGGPRSYRWINVTPLAKIWEQMNLAYRMEANQVWLVNVGDLKPMEYPIEYFLRLAWDPERWPKERIEEFGQLWAAREFGTEFSEEIEDLMTGYVRHNSRRKPELMEPNTYSLLNYNEAARIEAELDDRVARAENLYKKMPQNKKDAFFQLVLHPVKASSIITKLNIAVGKNRLYAGLGRADANDYAQVAKALFKADADLKAQYHSLNNGKWNGFMNQSHIGYISWNNPVGDQMPVVYDYTPGPYAEMGVTVEGANDGWPHTGNLALNFDQNGQAARIIEVYNRGTKPFDYTATASEDWIKLSVVKGKVGVVEQVVVTIDWSKLPEGVSGGRVSIHGTSWQNANVRIKATKPAAKILKAAKGFLETDGYIAIEAAHFTRKHSVKGFAWEEIEQHGRTHSAMSTFPVTDTVFKNPKKAPFLEYEVTFFSTGEFEIETFLAPTWPIVPDRGLRYAISVGKEKPQVVDFLKGMKGTDRGWARSVENGVRVGRSLHKVKKAGPTKIRIYMVDPAVTLQKIIVNTGGLLPSYLGPEESPVAD